MKILYGVQATGNGHISRARAMAPQLEAAGFEVDYLFSGREREDFFDMEGFGYFACHKGLTFVTERGRIRPIKTVQKNSIRQLFEDIKQLNLSDYDLVLTDFEPITAWAAKHAGKYCIGLGHQYAFKHNIPLQGDSIATRLLMKHFAPVNLGLGLHWHHFEQPILPPIVNLEDVEPSQIPNRIVVYLPFEDPVEISRMLRPLSAYQFVCFSPVIKTHSREGHLSFQPPSLEGFHQELLNCNGVICNAGFELASEALQLGKKLLVKPLMGQLEQLSNALALTQLGLGKRMDSLSTEAVQGWLNTPPTLRVAYPNVAKGIAEWLKAGKHDNYRELATSLWQQTRIMPVEEPQERPGFTRPRETGDRSFRW